MAKDPNAAERERRREELRAQLACNAGPSHVTITSKKLRDDGTANVRTKVVHCTRPKGHEGDHMWSSANGDQMVKWPVSQPARP